MTHDSSGVKSRSLLPWYVTDHLAPEDRDLVERHLTTCAECRRELADWSEVAGAASYASNLLQPPPLSRTRVWAALQAKIAEREGPLYDATGAPARDRVFHPRSTTDLGTMEAVAARDRERAMPQRPNRLLTLAAVIVALALLASLVGVFRAVSQHHSLPISPTPTPTVQRIYAQSNFGVVALNPATGKPEWQYPNAPFANQIAQAGNAVYFLAQPAGGGNELVALDARTGAIIWHAAAPSAFGMVAASGNVVYLASSNATPDAIAALNAATGAALWRVPLSSTDQVTQMLPTASGVLALLATGKLVSLRASDGGVAWQESGGYSAVLLDGATIYAAQTCGGSSIIIASTYNGCLAALALAGGTPLWSTQVARIDCTLLVICSGALGSPIAVGHGAVFAVVTSPASQQNGKSSQQQQVVAVSATSGAPLWQYPIAGSSGPSGSTTTFILLGADDHAVYIESSAGDVIALDAASHSVLWTARLLNANGAAGTQFLESQGIVYLITSSATYAIRASDGAILWSAVS